ncbi:hypothetical protein [Prevotella sp. E2-28]|uniref:hypothetical protein n=1 Tax=Prevotella sp. E2-28 TaxID=2913620 RepID=UPI001EDBBD28|nr:hypothetical protein [Prevotella sp. E2-28]UKK54582.1 hypothetical protein L6465_04805 [Prevotella sp. E2-28]
MLKAKTIKRMVIICLIVAILITVKVIWVVSATIGHGSLEGERKEIVHRANYLTSMVCTTPQDLLNEMPSGIGEQFQGEWALYTCSMTSAALANIAILYPQNKELSIKFIGQIIDIAMSEEIREYDRLRWREDPMDGIYGNLSHISYYSHLAWMISRYKQIGGDNKYDGQYHTLCRSMNRRILESPIMNLPTYPGESIYIPDMLVAIVALNNYASQYNGEYSSTVKLWVERAKKDWIDKETGLLASFLVHNGNSAEIEPPVKGSYSALNCYYLSLVDPDFAKEQYECLKKNFRQSFPFAGLKEYHDHTCLFGMDIDAGPIIFNISPSGTGFVIGAATSLEDMEFRNKLLKTAEICGSTVTCFGKSHYLLANVALVGEAIILAMRTSAPQTRM